MNNHIITAIKYPIFILLKINPENPQLRYNRKDDSSPVNIIAEIMIIAQAAAVLAKEFINIIFSKQGQ